MITPTRKKPLNTKGQPFYEIHGPDAKTGKERYYKEEGTFKGPRAFERVKKRINELVGEAMALTHS
jgi:hypothetical protein